MTEEVSDGRSGAREGADGGRGEALGSVDRPGADVAGDAPRGRHPVPSGRSPTDAGARLLRRHGRLRAFPLAGAAGAALAAPLALRAAQFAGLMTVALLLRALPDAHPFALVPVAAYPAFAAGVTVVSLPVLFCNAALIHGVDQVRRGNDPSLRAAFAAAARSLANVAALALVVGLTLALGGVTERKAGRTGPGPVGRTFGSSFTALTYLAGPAAVLEGASPRGMVRRSRALLEGRFGRAPTVDSGPLKRYLFVGLVPVMVVQVAFIVHVLLTGETSAEWLTHPAVMAVAAVPVWLSLVYGWAVAAVVKALLFVALRDGDDRLPLVNVPVERAVDTGAEP